MYNRKYNGFCSVCGGTAEFIDTQPSIRETYSCSKCKASLRERSVANAIISVFGFGSCTSIRDLAKQKHFSELNIFEPGVIGIIRKFISHLPNYHNSFFYEDASPGEFVEGVRNEDLENLSFLDNSFDLVITSDIFEHIRKPDIAFQDIFRVLKPNGVHIFSIPTLIPMKEATISRVDVSGSNDIHILEPAYHGNGKGGKSLVYNDFGEDIFSKLESYGFKTLTVSSDHYDGKTAKVISFISIALK